MSELAVTEKTSIQPWQVVDLSASRLALLRKQVAPGGTQQEFELFIEWCKGTGLNPFLKQAFYVERRTKVGNDWVSKYEPMVAEAGFAARADALPDFGGMRSGVVYAGDVFTIDEATQKITHTWSPQDRLKAGDKVIGAWAHGVRAGRIVEITYLTLASRQQVTRDGSATSFWARDPAGMLRKCARAEQYRRLYPNVFGGWYSDAEMADEGPETPALASRTESVAAKVAAKAQALPRVTPPPQQPVEAAPSPSGLVVVGTLRGRRLVELSTAELAQAFADHRSALAKASAAHLPVIQAGLAALEAEEAERQALIAAERDMP